MCPVQQSNGALLKDLSLLPPSSLQQVQAYTILLQRCAEGSMGNMAHAKLVEMRVGAVRYVQKSSAYVECAGELPSLCCIQVPALRLCCHCTVLHQSTNKQSTNKQ